jgi:hypothetical protein
MSEFLGRRNLTTGRERQKDGQIHSDPLARGQRDWGEGTGKSMRSFQRLRLERLTDAIVSEKPIQRSRGHTTVESPEIKPNFISITGAANTTTIQRPAALLVLRFATSHRPSNGPALKTSKMNGDRCSLFDASPLHHVVPLALV